MEFPERYECTDSIFRDAMIRNGRFYIMGPLGMDVIGVYAITGPYAVKRTRTMFLSRDQVDVEALINEAKGVTE